LGMEPDQLMRVYERLLARFGPQKWWPARSPFEVMVGAVLTQNTAWTNVEKAIRNLRAAGLLSARKLVGAPRDVVAELVRPSGYYNVKADRLLSFARWFWERYGGRVSAMRGATQELRAELLAVRGIGEETADSMLLYALGRPVFVVDAYTRRVLVRHGLLGAKAPYSEVQRFFEERLPRDASLYNEFHALWVALGKDVCRPSPRCEVCPLRECLPDRVCAT